MPTVCNYVYSSSLVTQFLMYFSGQELLLLICSLNKILFALYPPHVFKDYWTIVTENINDYNLTRHAW